MNAPLLRRLFRATFAGALLFGAAPSFAETEVVDGIEWTYTVSDGEATVCGDDWESSAISTNTTGVISVPSVLAGFPVTRIGDYAFRGCTKLTAISIPDGVTSIGSYAFKNCRELASITIPESVTSVDYYDCFDGCDNLRSATVPGTVSMEDMFGWSMCAQITNVIVSAGTTSICDSMFGNCSGLKSVTIPDSVTSIGSYAFHSCSELTSISIPNSVTRIGHAAFYGCPDALFNGETIPGVRLVDGWAVDWDWDADLAGELDLTGARGVADYAFSWCSGLTAVSIPAELGAISPGAFSGCSSLSVFVVSGDNSRYAARDGVLFSKDGSVLVCCPVAKSGPYAVPDDVTRIESEAFNGCSELISITIPDTVASVGEYAFSGCSSLTNALYNQSGTVLWHVPEETGISFAIPDSVTTIGDWSFSGCMKLTLLALPAGVKRIGDGAFAGCSALTMVSIPDGIEHIGDGAFEGCENLNRITFLGTVSGVSPSAFPYQAYSEWEDFAAAVPARLEGNLAEMGLDGISTNLYDEMDLHELDVRVASWDGTIRQSWTMPVVSNVTYTCSFPESSEFGETGYRYDHPGPEYADVSITNDTAVLLGFWTTNVLLQLEFGGWTSIASPPPENIVQELGETLSDRRTYVFPFGADSTPRAFGSFSPDIDVGSVTVCIGDSLVVTNDGAGRLSCKGVGGTVQSFGTQGYLQLKFASPPQTGQTVRAEYRVEYRNGSAVVVTTDGAIEEDPPYSHWAEIDSAPVPGYFTSDARLAILPEWSGDVDGVFLEEYDDRYGLFIPTDRPRHVLVRSRGIDELVETGTTSGHEWSNGPVVWDGYGETTTTIFDAGWRLAADPTANDGYSLRSEEIKREESAAIRLPLDGAGTLSFDWKISSGRGHYARFYLDGVATTNITRSTEWQSVELALGDGPHVLQWSYEKGMTDDAGEDAAFLDNVCWAPLTLEDALDATNLVWKTDSALYYATGGDYWCEVVVSTNLGATSSEVRTYDYELDADIVPGSVSITIGGSIAFRDDGAGGLVGMGSSGSGSINYESGLVQFKFNGAIATGPVSATYRCMKYEEPSIIELSRPNTVDGWGWTPVVSVSSDGKDSVRSPGIYGKSSSRLSTTVLGPGTLAWKWRADVAGSAGVDVYLDGEDLYDDGIYLEGDSGWTDATLEIDGFAKHTIVFEYWNAGNTNTLSDCAYIDQMSWTPSKPATVIVEGVEIPVSWIDEEALPFVETSGGDYETAAKSVAANGENAVWECYVNGVDPTNAADRLLATIEMEDGEPVVRWTPDLNEGGTKNLRVYTVEGKTNLVDRSWGPTNESTRFFRVRVEMP